MAVRRRSGARTLAALCLLTGLGPALLAGCGDDGDGGGGADPAPVGPSTDPQPAADAAAWLTGELTGGLVRNEQYDLDDVGLTLDVALALDAAGTEGAEADVEEIATAVAVPAVLTGYVGTAEAGLQAGPTAKTVLLAQAADRDPRRFAGTDLVAQLEGLVSTEPDTAGRVADTGPEDYTTVIGQAYAVWALGDADSPGATDATSYLLTQQCPDGWFRGVLPAPAAGQSCDDDPGSVPDVDTTALAVLALLSRAEEDAEASAAADLAVRWLLDNQSDDGSFLGETTAPGPDDDPEQLTGVPNANSTGLAAWALGEFGETEAAAEAAAWLRTLQVPADAGDPLAADAGAVAYDEAGLAAGETDGIGPEQSDQWRRATAQALPGLAYATP
jgi:hypothetical protein